MAKTGDGKPDGVTVQQIENFSKKHRIEIFFCIVFILSSFFSFVFYGPGWSVYAAGLGGAVAIWIPKFIGKGSLAAMHFCLKQNRITRIVIGVIGVVFSIFLPPLVFLCIGLIAGRNFHRQAIESMKMGGCSKDSCNEEHHP